MKLKLGMKQPFWEKPDDGSGGGAPETPPAPVVESYDWGDDIDDDLKAFAADKSPLDILREGFKHKQGSSRRDDQITKELLENEEWGKSFAEQKGLAKLPSSDEEFLDFAKSRISEDTEYKHPKIDGVESSDLDGWATASRNNGVLPSQYKGMIEEIHANYLEASQQHADTVDTELKAEWGEAYDENVVHIEAAMKSFGEDGDGLLAAIASIPNESKKKAAVALAAFGRGIGTAEHDRDGGLGVGGSIAAIPWADALQLLRDRGSMDKMTDHEKAQYNASYEADKAQKAKAK